MLLAILFDDSLICGWNLSSLLRSASRSYSLRSRLWCRYYRLRGSGSLRLSSVPHVWMAALKCTLFATIYSCSSISFYLSFSSRSNSRCCIFSMLALFSSCHLASEYIGRRGEASFFIIGLLDFSVNLMVAFLAGLCFLNMCLTGDLDFRGILSFLATGIPSFLATFLLYAFPALGLISCLMLCGLELGLKIYKSIELKTGFSPEKRRSTFLVNSFVLIWLYRGSIHPPISKRCYWSSSWS